MKQNYILLSLLFLPLVSFASTPVTGKTFFKQGIGFFWHYPTTLSTPLATPKKDVTMHTTLSFEPFYFTTTNKSAFGKYFGYYDATLEKTNDFTGVAATDDTLPLYPQDIIHDADNSASFANATLNPLKDKITFEPWIEQYGAVLSTHTQFGEQYCLRITMPWMHTTHTMGFKTAAGGATQTVEGAAVSFLNFLQGTVVQEAAGSKNLQTAVSYGKFKNKQSSSGLADLTITFDSFPLRKKEMSVILGGTLLLPTTGPATGEYLFEPLIGSGGHVFVGGHITMQHQLHTFAEWGTVRFTADLAQKVGIATQEIRSLDFMHLDGTQGNYSRYALTGKEYGRRLFPFINLLTMPVNVTPGSDTTLTAAFSLQAVWYEGQIGYRFHHTDGEKITLLQDWPANTYAISTFDYKTTGSTGNTDPIDDYDTFLITKHSFDKVDISSPGLPINEDRLYKLAAVTPAQSSHTLFASLRAVPFKNWDTSFFVAGAYHFVGGSNFGIEGYSLTLNVSHPF